MKEKQDRELQREGKVTRGSVLVCVCVIVDQCQDRMEKKKEGEGRGRKSFVSE